MENSHINESILSEEIMTRKRTGSIIWTHSPGMEYIGSDVMDQVVSAMNAMDYDKYTEADVSVLLHTTSVHRKILLLFFCCLPLLEEIAQAAQKRRVSILATAFICSHRSTLPTTVKTTAFTVVSTATTRSTSSVK